MQALRISIRPLSVPETQLNCSCKAICSRRRTAPKEPPGSGTLRTNGNRPRSTKATVNRACRPISVGNVESNLNVAGIGTIQNHHCERTGIFTIDLLIRYGENSGVSSRNGRESINETIEVFLATSTTINDLDNFASSLPGVSSTNTIVYNTKALAASRSILEEITTNGTVLFAVDIRNKPLWIASRGCPC